MSAAHKLTKYEYSKSIKNQLVKGEHSGREAGKGHFTVEETQMAQ